MEEFLLKLGGSLLLSLVLHFGLLWIFAITLAYWICLAICLVIVFGGILIWDDFN